MNIISQINQIKKEIKGEISFGESLSKHSWFNLGGPAKVIFKPNDLKELSKLHKVNKYDLGYIDVYEKYFDKIKNKNLQILEIGVDKGPSLKLWSKYFRYSKIVGIDNKYIKLDIENVETFFGDQTDI